MRTGHLTLLACLLYAVTQTCLAQPSFEQWDMRTAPPAQAGAETAPPVAWDSAVKAGEPGGPTASISKPKANSLVRAMVPVFGTADAPDFKSFRLEFGKGTDPKEWILINASPEPQREDPYATGRTSWEKRVPKGNLGMWDTGLTEYAYAGTWKHNLLGVHTLRLTVEDKQGRKAEVRVTVDVARVIPNQLGGKSESEDGLVSVAVPPEAMSSSFPLISIRRTEEAKPQPGLMDVGGVYEWQPPGLEFTKPATLTFKYDPAKLQPDIELSKLGIYWLNQTDRRWFRLTSKADDKTFVVTAELKRAPMYRAFFGLFADVEPPEAPKLSDVPTRAQGRKLALKGKTDPHHTVIASVDGKEFKFTATHEGDFQGVVELREGENHVLLRAVDAADNASPTIGPYTIQMAYLHPRKVKAIKFLGPTAPARGDRLLIQLEGEDASADTADTTLATVSATKSDPKGFPVELVETGKDTGTYVGVIELSDKTSGLDQRLAIGKDGEDIVAVSVAAPDVRATRAYRDRIPPTAPAITCREDKRACWDTFEGGSHTWTPTDGDVGAVLSVQSLEARQFLAFAPGKASRSHLGATRQQTRFKVEEFPVISFDYCADPGASVDFIFHLDGPSPGWRGLGFTDQAHYYPRLSHFYGARADGRWRHAEINLLPVLRNRYAPLSSFSVSNVGFINLNGGEYYYLSRRLPDTSPTGTFRIDNFAIMRYHPQRSATFTWLATDDSGVADYSLLLDQSPTTVPEETASQSEPQKTYSDLKDGRHWFHVRARDRNGNWGPPSHYLLVVDLEPPTAQAPELSSPWRFGEPMSIKLHDSASGIDPDSIALTIDHQSHGMSGNALDYDEERGMLTFHPTRVKPWAGLFAHGQDVSVELTATDRAGHPLPEPLRFTLKAQSPLVLSPPNPDGKNGWYLKEPSAALDSSAASAWKLQLRPAADGFGEWRVLRQVMLTRARTDPPATPDLPPPMPRAQEVVYAKLLRVDTAAPKTRAAPIGKQKDDKTWLPPLLVKLEHDDYPLVPGGLLGRYYRQPDFADPMLERLDPFVHFHDEHPRSNPLVIGAKSGRWDGALYFPAASAEEFEISVWTGVPAKATVWLDGEEFLKWPDPKNPKLGYMKQQRQFTQGLHKLRVEFADPARPQWSCMFFHWRKGTGYDASVRTAAGPEMLYYPRNVATILYQLDGEPAKPYREPISIPEGQHTLKFHSEDEAGHVEPDQTLTFTVAP